MERMYNFIDSRWNPLGGECPHACTYCYVNQFRKRFKNNKKYVGEPRLIESEFKNLGSGKTYFVCSMIDLFAEKIPFEFKLRVLEHCRKYDNTYFFQTKNTDGMHYQEFIYPEKSIFCATIESNRFYENYYKAPWPIGRSVKLGSVLLHQDLKAWENNGRSEKGQITIEPIMDFDLEKFVEIIDYSRVGRVFIGADSGGNNLPEPSKEKVLQLISELEKFTKVYQKPTLARLLK